MAEETLTEKLWKLASYSAYDLLGFGSGSASNATNKSTTNNANDDHKKKEKVKPKSIWPSFVKSKSDKCCWGQYDEPDASQFIVRGQHYLNNKIKKKSKKSLFTLANLELYDCAVNESYHIVTHNKSWYHKYHKQLPNDTFYLIYNLQLSSLNTSVVATFVLKTNQPPNTNTNTHKNHQNKLKHLLINDQNLIDEMLNDLSDSSESDSDSDTDKIVAIDKPDNHNQKKQTKNDENIEIEEKEMEELEKKEEKQSSDKVIKFTEEDIENMPNIEQVIHSDNIVNDNSWYPKLGYKPYDNLVWDKFLNGDELFINQRLKTIPRIVEGSWYFTFPQRPALLGMKTPQRCYRGSNYLEIDCEADNSMLVAQIAKAAYHISTYLAVDIVITIEGQQENQLPERILGGFQIRYADTTKAIKLT